MENQTNKLREVLRKVYDPRVGLIRHVEELRLHADDPSLYVVMADCVKPAYFRKNATATEGTDITVKSNGAHLDRESAWWALLGETFERYCASIYFEEDLLVATANDIGSHVIDLKNLIGYSDDQLQDDDFPYIKPRKDNLMRWVRGTKLGNDSPHWIPAQLVYLGYEVCFPGEWFAPQISTGLACGQSKVHASVSGILECIERDSFMSIWMLGYQAPKLDIESVRDLVDDRLDPFLNSGRFIHYWSCVRTNIGIPVVVCMVRTENANTYTVGAAANTSLANAVVKATTEAHHTRLWGHDILRSKAMGLYPEEPVDFEHHVATYIDGQNVAALAPLMLGPKLSKTDISLLDSNNVGSNAEDRLERLCVLLAQAGFNVYDVDVTTDDVRELGLSVTKSIIPGLQPLHVGQGKEHRDLRRLRCNAASWGVNMPNVLNLAPHPFP